MAVEAQKWAWALRRARLPRPAGRRCDRRRRPARRRRASRPRVRCRRAAGHNRADRRRRDRGRARRRRPRGRREPLLAAAQHRRRARGRRAAAGEHPGELCSVITIFPGNGATSRTSEPTSRRTRRRAARDHQPAEPARARRRAASKAPATIAQLLRSRPAPPATATRRVRSSASPTTSSSCCSPHARSNARTCPARCVRANLRALASPTDRCSSGSRARRRTATTTRWRGSSNARDVPVTVGRAAHGRRCAMPPCDSSCSRRRGRDSAIP